MKSVAHIFEQFLATHPSTSSLDKAMIALLEAAISLKAFALFSLPLAQQSRNSGIHMIERWHGALVRRSQRRRLT